MPAAASRARSRDGAPASRRRPKLRPAAGRACPPPSPQWSFRGQCRPPPPRRRRRRFDQFRRRPVACQCGGDGAGRAAAAVARGPRRPGRRKRGCGGGARGGASGRVAAATLQRLVGSLTESLGNLGPKLRIDGAASWRRDVRANCGAIVAAIVRHTTRRARPRWRAGAAIPRRAGRFGQVWLNSGRCAFGTRGPGRPAESSASCLCVPRARDGPASERPLRRCLEVCSNYKQCRTSRKSHRILVRCLLGESAG